MPSVQRGSVVKKGRKWQARWYDENNARQSRSAFETRAAARDWLDAKVRDVAALRRGEVIPVAHRPQTVDALLDMFLERHGATVDAATKRKLERQLKLASPDFRVSAPSAKR
jgi:hypothetical protein